VSEVLAMTIPQTAKALNISRGQAYALAKKGVIPTVWLGGRKVVPMEALRNLLQPNPATNSGIPAK